MRNLKVMFLLHQCIGRAGITIIYINSARKCTIQNLLILHLFLKDSYLKSAQLKTYPASTDLQCILFHYNQMGHIEMQDWPNLLTKCKECREFVFHGSASVNLHISIVPKFRKKSSAFSPHAIATQVKAVYMGRQLTGRFPLPQNPT